MFDKVEDQTVPEEATRVSFKLAIKCFPLLGYNKIDTVAEAKEKQCVKDPLILFVLRKGSNVGNRKLRV